MLMQSESWNSKALSCNAALTHVALASASLIRSAPAMGARLAGSLYHPLYSAIHQRLRAAKNGCITEELVCASRCTTAVCRERASCKDEECSGEPYCTNAAEKAGR